MFHIIVAYYQHSRGIGLQNQLPWDLPEDRKWFRAQTLHGILIMGRRTWESLPVRPLPDRINIIVSNSGLISQPYPANVHVCTSLDAALQLAASFPSLPRDWTFQPHECMPNHRRPIFVIGGAQLYTEALRHPQCASILATEFHTPVEVCCDTFFPDIPFPHIRTPPTLVSIREDYDYLLRTVITHEVIDPSHAEHQYLQLIDTILTHGNLRDDRTGTGTFSLFAPNQLRFNLRESFPLLTTKRVFWRGVAEELLWFIRGDTNVQSLRDKNIHIWDANGSREFLDARGLAHREEGDLGPVYGFQWRHFGATYRTMHDDYSGQGVDQLRNVIRQIQTNPTDRRIVLTAWNPVDLDQMALPPCHMFCQFYVHNGELSCQLYQRSADLGLGVPFNIASYALLTCLLAHVCHLRPGDFIHVMGDAHIYRTHVDALRLQRTRQPLPFPTLSICPNVRDIDEIRFEHLTLHDYRTHPAIPMPMAT